jgi:D-serine deaminase-like pyridoxal phosphate-dependent protein
MNIYDLDTPAMIVDLDIMERNLQRVAAYARDHQLRLRPHAKTHKSPVLARRQIDLGAVGITVAKTGEAEVMLAAKPQDLLVAYPVIGTQKLQRLTKVAEQTRVTVALDSICAARSLSMAASAAGLSVGVLAEIDVGLHRVGVQPGPELLNLVRGVSELPGLSFEGITFYPGHIRAVEAGLDASVSELSKTVGTAVSCVEDGGFPVRIVSGGSTPALFRSHDVARLNEIRPGTYIFNDRNTVLIGACTFDDCAASVLATVVSTAVKGQVIIDGGSKTFSSDGSMAAADAPGFGHFPDCREAILDRMNEEHGFVDISKSARKWAVGEKIRVIPNHVCVAMNLHEQVYGIRGDTVEEVWRVEARGKLQ